MAEIRLPSADQFERIIQQMEILNAGTQIDDYTGSPGGKVLMAGDKNNGFYGVVPHHAMGSLVDNPINNKVFNAQNLALAVGITQGAAQFDETPWLKFSRNGRILYVPLKPIRRSLSWDHIYSAGAVYGTGSAISTGEQFMLDNDGNYGAGARVAQNARIKAGSFEFIVRLMKGAGNDPTNSYDNADRGSDGPANEWNNLILPLHEKAPSSFAYNQYADTPRPDWGIGFSDSDLLTHNRYGTGSYQWMQETRDTVESSETGTIRRVVRGNYGASHLGASPSSLVFSSYGWRPVLELL